jgi:superfamily II DNA helicase RecQ
MMAGAATAGGCDDNRLKACIVAALTSIWGVPDRFPAQLNAVFCLLHPMKPNHLAVVERTGAGKTHILRMLDVIERGIVLIFIPLLTLLADVMSKFTCANHRFGTVIIQHLDELFDANKSAYKDLLEQCRGLRCSMTTTVFLFLSPQFLINHSNAREIFIKCSHCTTL